MAKNQKQIMILAGIILLAVITFMFFKKEESKQIVNHESSFDPILAPYYACIRNFDSELGFKTSAQKVAELKACICGTPLVGKATVISPRGRL